jgi:hypothetical protein
MVFKERSRQVDVYWSTHRHPEASRLSHFSFQGFWGSVRQEVDLPPSRYQVVIDPKLRGRFTSCLTESHSKYVLVLDRYEDVSFLPELKVVIRF